MENELTQPYVIEWGDGADYVCQACANEWVKRNGLEWENDHSLNYVKENFQGLSVWVDFYGEIESDSPQACECGQWLRVHLTPDGENYLRDNAGEFPQFVLDHYRIETYLV